EGQNPAQWRGHLDHLLAAPARVRRTQHFAALGYSEMPSFMVDLRLETGIAARALEYLILTAARAGEVLRATGAEIDVGGRLWVIPPERMKSGREHRVPLTPRPVPILREMAEVRQNQFVFPGLYKRADSVSNSTLLRIVRELRPGITVHGFRATFKG